MQRKIVKRQSTRNQRDRVATANVVSRRSGNRCGNQNRTNRLFAKEVHDVPVHAMKHTDSKIDLLYERLK